MSFLSSIISKVENSITPEAKPRRDIPAPHRSANLLNTINPDLVPQPEPSPIKRADSTSIQQNIDSLLFVPSLEKPEEKLDLRTAEREELIKYLRAYANEAKNLKQLVSAKDSTFKPRLLDNEAEKKLEENIKRLQSELAEQGKVKAEMELKMAAMETEIRSVDVVKKAIQSKLVESEQLKNQILEKEKVISGLMEREQQMKVMEKDLEQYLEKKASFVIFLENESKLAEFIEKEQLFSKFLDKEKIFIDYLEKEEQFNAFVQAQSNQNQQIQTESQQEDQKQEQKQEGPPETSPQHTDTPMKKPEEDTKRELEVYQNIIKEKDLIASEIYTKLEDYQRQINLLTEQNTLLSNNNQQLQQTPPNTENKQNTPLANPNPNTNLQKDLEKRILLFQILLSVGVCWIAILLLK